MPVGFPDYMFFLFLFLKIILDCRGFYSILAVFSFLLVHNDFSWILEHKVDRFDFGNWHMWCTLFTDNLWCFQVRGVASRAIHIVKSRKSYSYEIASGCYVWWWAGIITFKLGVIPGQMVIWRPVCSATVLLTYFFFFWFSNLLLWAFDIFVMGMVAWRIITMRALVYIYKLIKDIYALLIASVIPKLRFRGGQVFWLV